MVGGLLVGTILAPLMVRLVGLEGAMLFAGGLVALITLLAFPKARAIDRAAAVRAAELSDRIALLQRTGIFEDAARPALEALAVAAVREDVGTGTVVIREGDPADDLFVIRSGTVGVSAGKQSLGELGPDDHFGEIGILERVPRTATVTALTDCELYRIAGGDFLRSVSEAPRMSGRLLSTVATRLARTHPHQGSDVCDRGR